MGRGWGGGGDRWVALGPGAMAALDAERLPYAVPEDLVPWAELVALCAAVHERVERLCDELDRRLWARHPALARDELRPFRFQIYPLTNAFDSIASRVFHLRRVLDAHPGL